MSGIVGGAGSKSGIIGETELDYETGSWTPTNSNAVQSPNGTYTKIGNVVTCSFYLVSHATSGTTGDFGGLPFTSSSELSGAANLAGSGVVAYTNNGSIQYTVKVMVSGTTWRMLQTYEHKQLNADKNMIGTLTYLAA